MTRTMYDGITVSNLPIGAPLYAGYVDGRYANLPALRKRFPKARIVEIAVRASTLAGHVLDVETGDATPAEAVGWVVARRHAGGDPTVYCNSATWPAVKAAFANSHVAPPHYWIAAYSSDSSIPAGAVAHQWKSTATYDQSTVAAYWPGVDPAPTPVQEDDVTEQDKQDIINGVVAKLLDSDGWFAAPKDAADYKTNRFWTLRSWLESALPAARNSNQVLAQLGTRLAAIEKKLGL